MTNKLGEVLKNMRTKKSMSLREFSEYLGISHTYLSKLEKGMGTRADSDISPTIETLTKIATGLNIPLADFMYQCGYFDCDILKTYREESSKNKELELKQYIQKIKSDILYSEKVTYNSVSISDIDLRVITETLEIGLDIILKNKSK